MIKVHAAAIEHGNGVNLYLGLTETSVETQLADFCRNWWDDAKELDDSLASDPDRYPDAECIERYFNAMGEHGGEESLIRFDPMEVK